MKKQMLSKRIGFLSLFFLLIFSNVSWSQDKIVKPTKPKEWTLLAEHERYAIYYRYDECDKPSEGTHREYVYLKMENKTNNPIQLAWDLEVHYGKKCINCASDSPEMHFELNLPANASKEGSCADETDQKMIIFSRTLNFDHPVLLTDFKLNNLHLTRN